MSTTTISAITAFGITFSVAMGACLVANPESYKSIPVWLITTLGAMGTALKDLRSSFRLPPLNGDDSKTQT